MRNPKGLSVSDKKNIIIAILATIIVTSIVVYTVTLSTTAKLAKELKGTETGSAIRDNDIIVSNENTIENIIISAEEDDAKEEKSEPLTVVTLSAIGDIMCSTSQIQSMYNKDTNQYNFSSMFSKVKNYTRFSDITIGNLETSFAGEELGYSGLPYLNAPDSLRICAKGGSGLI